jgi:hypothetical protein
VAKPKCPKQVYVLKHLNGELYAFETPEDAVDFNGDDVTLGVYNLHSVVDVTRVLTVTTTKRKQKK